MASSSVRRRDSMEIPPSLADVFRLRDEFNQLYERHHPQLQQCIDKLHGIIKTFEKDFRGSTVGSKTAGEVGIIGGTAFLAGLALAPFTLGISAVASVGGAAALTGAGIQSKMCSSKKKQQLKALREGIESELKDFQNKINPLAEKIKDMHEGTKKVLGDLKKLEQSANSWSQYFDCRNINPRDLAELTEQMDGSMRLITTIANIFGGFSLVLDMISVKENSSTVGDMDKLAGKSIDEEIDESKIRSKAGKFVVEIRKSINQLQNIVDELEKTKHKLSGL